MKVEDPRRRAHEAGALDDELPCHAPAGFGAGSSARSLRFHRFGRRSSVRRNGGNGIVLFSWTGLRGRNARAVGAFLLLSRDGGGVGWGGGGEGEYLVNKNVYSRNLSHGDERK